jgi:hypothetical protein
MKNKDVIGTPQPNPPGAPRKVRVPIIPRDDDRGFAVPRKLFE